MICADFKKYILSHFLKVFEDCQGTFLKKSLDRGSVLRLGGAPAEPLQSPGGAPAEPRRSLAYISERTRLRRVLL